MVPPPINSVPFRVFPWTTSKAIIQGRNDIPHKKTERKASILDPRLRPIRPLIPRSWQDHVTTVAFFRRKDGIRVVRAKAPDQGLPNALIKARSTRHLLTTKSSKITKRHLFLIHSLINR